MWLSNVRDAVVIREEDREAAGHTSADMVHTLLFDWKLDFKNKYMKNNRPTMLYDDIDGKHY